MWSKDTWLEAVRSTIESDATVATWATAVLISDVGDYEEPAPQILAPYVVVKDGPARVIGRDSCGNNEIEVYVRVWVVVEYEGTDPARGVRDAAAKLADVKAALEAQTCGLSDIVETFRWEEEPESDKPFIDPDGYLLPFHRAQAVLRATARETV